MTDRGIELGSGGIRAKVAIGLLYVFALLEVATMLSRAMTISLLGKVRAGESVADAALQADDDRTGIVAIVYLAVLLSVMLAYCLWLYRASKTAHGIGGDQMVITPGWSIGWHFVPFANLVMPFRAIVEI